MQPLQKPLRNKLEATVKAAREQAELAARSALEHLGVGEKEAPDHLDDDQRALRRRLRAHARQLSDALHRDDTQETTRLVREVAYEQWHRMLFARFLAENQLLMWEPGAPVTLADCAEMAQDASLNMGARSGWELAGMLASRMLPQVFRPDSPALAVDFAPEHERALEQLLADLPTDVFRASDSLGWVYQFWQAKRKDEVNKSETKIGADELPAVTQLFTEPYMVDFLLHNSLGAWWVTRHPDSPCPVELTYMRRLEDGTPAAGRYEGWPDALGEFKLLDPCCGSGHFLVAAFLMLVPMRMHAEGLSPRDAVDAVLRDNLHGLELDARCVEIAAFALAMTAWRFPDTDGRTLGYRPLPSFNLACCGLSVSQSEKEWLSLAGDDEVIRGGMKALYSAFKDAPLLGSLIAPERAAQADTLFGTDFATLQPLLEQALAKEESDEATEAAIAAKGLAVAARLLTSRYHLVVTNVPYLTRGKQSEHLKAFCEARYPTAKNDLANVFLERCLELTKQDGVVQIIMPQNWLFLPSYKKQREILLKRTSWNLLARLGEGGFESSQAAGAFIILLTISQTLPYIDSNLRGLNVSELRSPKDKASALLFDAIIAVSQDSQLRNPDSRILLDEVGESGTLGDYADSYWGQGTGDFQRFGARFWEPNSNNDIWELMQSTVDSTCDFGGRSYMVRWEGGKGELISLAEQLKQTPKHQGIRPYRGSEAWSHWGVTVSLMRSLSVTIYTGQLFDGNCAAVVPRQKSNLPAIYCFCSSKAFKDAIRRIDHKLNVTNLTLVKAPFDLEYWQQVAAEKYPNGLPKPYSDDPTQWIFHGHPQPSTNALQVAVARLLGYAWPAETDTEMELSEDARAWIARCGALDKHVDDDGIVCLSPIRGERPAADRLLELLIDAWETVEPGSWKSSILDKLLAEADSAGKGLDVWLRDRFFEQHIRLFHHRPFVWHVWDGLKDGFGALVNYHKLDRKKLERLIHTYLGDWIRTQDQAAKDGVDGAEQRLTAAKQLKAKLEAILEGEAPYDIFVRWKPIEQQPVGWEPDLNDGVRLNIRPFMTAEVLRHNKPPKLNIKWDKDRGKDVESAPWFDTFKGERINDHHLSLAEKQAARRNLDVVKN